MRRYLVLGIGLVVALLIAGLAWLALSARQLAGELQAVRADLGSAQVALQRRQAPELTAALQSATAHGQAAQQQLDQPVWTLARLVPRLGDTPEALAAITSAVNQALAGISPAAANLVKIDPNALVQAGGRVDLQPLQAAGQQLDAAAQALAAAQTSLADSPSRAGGALVLGQVDEAGTQLRDALAQLSDQVGSLQTAAKLLPPLLGADGTKRYFLGFLNPNEARGAGGGFLGTWGVLRADNGTLVLERVGSNTDLQVLDKLPPGLGPEFADRYSQDALDLANMNISPNFPDAAQIWLAAYEKTTGERLDGAIATDVVGLGDMLTAAGQSITLPDGRTMNGEQLTDFAVAGIYEQFPTPAQSAERKQFTETAVQEAVKVVTSARQPAALLKALGQAASQERILLWVANKDLQEAVADTGLSGEIAVPAGPHVKFVAINGSGSKLDTYLTRKLTYDVGRCPNSDGLVSSRVQVVLENAVPPGKQLPEYVIGMAPMGPEGPMNKTLAQLHLPNGALVTDVKVNGAPIYYTPFTERGRPAVLLPVELPTRTPQTIEVDFFEPGSSEPGQVAEQPLLAPQTTTVQDVPCQSAQDEAE